MMNILVGKFVLEANENIPTKCDLVNVDLKLGQECIDRLQTGDVFKRDDIHLIPSNYAEAGSSGVMKRTAFDYIENTMLNAVRAHLNEIDGIYLHLHGASEVEGLGSGEHHIMKEIRKIVGPYLPIAVACDPHGNLCKEYVDECTIIRSYRNSPHTDIEATVQFVCKKLIEQIEHPTGIKPAYRKLPMILGGEQSVSNDEPVRTINQHMNELEKDPRILSCSWHVGYIRHDTDVAGCGVVVIPSDQKYHDFAEQTADELAAYVFERRHEFHYTGLTMSPDKALEAALSAKEGPVFITDSGDNVTSGATGANTFVLRQFLSIDKLNKKVLFAAIHDDRTYHQLDYAEVGATMKINLGMNYDELSAPVPLTVKILNKGRQEGTKLFAENGDFGGAILVEVVNKKIDIIITDTNHPFVEPHQTMAAGASWDNYDITIVKTGYAFPDVLRCGKLAIMSLTEGATLQDTTRLKFKRIMRPMYPIDNI